MSDPFETLGKRVVGPAHLAGAAFDRAPAPMFVTAADGDTVIEANRAAQQELGLDTIERFSLLSKVAADDRAAVADRIDACQRTRQPGYTAAHFLLDGGTRARVELNLSPIQRPGGLSIVAIARRGIATASRAAGVDQHEPILEMIARHRPLEEVLGALGELMRRFFPAAAPTILLRSPDAERVIGGEALAPERIASLRSTLPGEAGPVASAWAQQLPVIVADTARDERWRAASTAALEAGFGALWIVPFSDQAASASAVLVLPFRDAGAPGDADLERLGHAAQLGKLALEEQATARQLYDRAYCDPVTRLPNRSLLYDRLGQAIELARRRDECVAVIMLDLDGFKTVNDSVGHTRGDELLCDVAARLAEAIGEGETVARLGGDEFALLRPVTDADAAARVAEPIQDSLGAPFEIDGYRFITTASMGVALYPRDGPDADALLQAADTALYAAKEAGRNRYHFHSEQLNARAKRRIAVESGLRHGLAAGELRCFYQPIVASATQQTLALEGLIRWQHPEQGLLGPAHFLEYAEASDLICELDHWLLAQAAADLDWLAGQGHRPKVSVNVSPRDLELSDFVERLLATLDAGGLAAGRCEIEITENVLMPDVARARQQIHALKRRAPELRIVVDDFGTGYASLHYLRDLPIDGLKIDRSFIQAPAGGAGNASRAITRAIAELGRHLGLCVTAEGIETAEHLAIAEEIGCDRLQGFRFARPMDRDRLADHLATPARANRKLA
jgi:diguanylate cyclase (GGDEF)-like protein